MEELNKIRQEVLKSKTKIVKALELGKEDYKYFSVDHKIYFITPETFGLRHFEDDNVVELEVSNYCGREKITLYGDVTKAVKLAHSMKQWKKIAELAKQYDNK